jgi:Subtilase family
MPRTATPQRAPFRPRVMVKFHDHLRLPYVDGAERGFGGADRKFWKKLSQSYPDLRLLRVYRSVHPLEVMRLVQRAQNLSPGYLPPNFLTYFFLEEEHPQKRDQLVRDLLQWARVERAHVQTEPPPPPTVDYGSDPDSALQTHLNDAPDGVGVKNVWADGADGTSVTIADIEQGWGLPHSDLPPVEVLKPGTSVSQVHGTRTLGVLAALDNDEGGIGLAPKASLCIAGESETEATVEREDAMMASIDRLGFGDVLLLEMQTGSDPLLPVEVEPSLRDLMKLATALGIIVVEPAANGGADGRGVDLDDVLGDDTGAIRVAAAYEPEPTTDLSKKWQRYPTSNFGSGIHCFALGYMVATTEIGSTSVGRSFKETSAASAIVAGAAAVLQSWYEKYRGYRIGPLDLRSLFMTHGTPPALLEAGGTDRIPIGVMPDLKDIMATETASASALLIRDSDGDDGTSPSTVYGQSPDIVLSGSPLSVEALKGPSKTFAPPIFGDSFWAYVRVHNRGSVAIENVVVDLYSFPLGLMLPHGYSRTVKDGPGVFVPLMKSSYHEGTMTVGTIAAGSVGVGAAYFKSSIQHLVAVARTSDSPAPSVSTITAMKRWKQFITHNPNVASKQVVRVSIDALRSMKIPIGPVPHLPWHLVVTSTLQADVAVELELPPYLVEQIFEDLWKKPVPPVPGPPWPDPFPPRTRIPIAPGQPITLGPFLAPAGDLVNATLRTRGRSAVEQAGEIRLQLLHEGAELSRLVFVVGPERRPRDDRSVFSAH